MYKITTDYQRFLVNWDERLTNLENPTLSFASKFCPLLKDAAGSRLPAS
jgi:hypothetical protein